MNILVVGPSWIGDTIMAQTLFILLKKRNQTANIDVIAPKWSQALLSRMPEVRDAFDLPFAHGEINLGGRFKIGKELRSKQYDQAIVLPNSLKSALIPFWAKIPIRTGWRGEMRYGLLNDIRQLDKKLYPLMIQRFAALGLPKKELLPTVLRKPKLLIDKTQLNQSLHKLQLNTKKPILAMCPGAEYGPAKRWPTNYFADTANSLIKDGWQIWLFGSTKDQDIGLEIMKNIKVDLVENCQNLIGQTNLLEAIDLLSTSSCVLTNDSGLMHLASALNKPIVAIYGSSSPTFTPPLSDQINIMSLQLSCSPCFKRDCPLQHLDCLKKLYPETVIQAIQQMVTTAEYAHITH